MYLSGVTGLATADIIECMKRFCAPDPYSRTQIENGARLTLIDAHRDWGWIIVNHAKYREKARLISRDNARTETGEDAQRKRAERLAGLPAMLPDEPMSPDVPRCPPPSPPQTQTQTKTKTKTKTEEIKQEAQAPILDIEAWERWVSYRHQVGKAIKLASIPAAQRKLASFGEVQAQVVEESIANGYQGLFAPSRLNGSGKVSKWE